MATAERARDPLASNQLRPLIPRADEPAPTQIDRTRTAVTILGPREILALQRSAGNRAAGTALQKCAPSGHRNNPDSPLAAPCPGTRPQLTIQRDTPKAGKKKIAGGSSTAAVLAAQAAIEANWMKVSQVCAPYKELIPWLGHGQMVVELIKAHTAGALASIKAKDDVLTKVYTEAARTDKITYDYIAWHMIAYVNLLSLRGSVSSLINAFDHDKDRPFRNRANAERITRELMKSIDGVGPHSASALSLIATKTAVAHSRLAGDVTLTVTTPQLDPKAEALFRDATTGMQNLQVSVQAGAEFLDQWTDEAFEQGLEQAAEALEEYYKVTKILGGKSKDKKPRKGKKKQTEPGAAPHAVPAPGSDEDEQKVPAKMRFQVQWNSRAKRGKGQFSQVAAAPADKGVSTLGAVAALRATHALVVPERAKRAAEPAAGKQEEWIKSRPPGGVTGQMSWSEKFPYDYPDARVDVENLRGHNLRH